VEKVPQSAQESVKYSRVNNLNIHVCSAGKGTPLLLIHGFMGMIYDWRSNIPELGKRFSVFALDLPGFGYSEKPLSFDYTSSTYAEFIVSFLDLHNIKRVVLVGNSMGGQIALMICLKYPDRVSGLVLIDSGGYPQSVEFLPFRLLKVPVIGEISMALLDRNIIRTMLRKGIYYDGSLVNDEIVDVYNSVYNTANARKMPPRIMRRIMKDEANIASHLSEIRCQTLIIWGANDKVISPSRAKQFHHDIKQAALLMVPEAGHMPHVEQPEIVNKAIVDYFG
jgi:pimeloyl-ACP methyl ester carboxylesterase